MKGTGKKFNLKATKNSLSLCLSISYDRADPSYLPTSSFFFIFPWSIFVIYIESGVHISYQGPMSFYTLKVTYLITHYKKLEKGTVLRNIQNTCVKIILSQLEDGS